MVSDAREIDYPLADFVRVFSRRVLVSASRAIASNCNKDKAIFASISSISVNAVLPESRN
jgi:hypothetical protein